jgi:hypothetical protein
MFFLLNNCYELKFLLYNSQNPHHWLKELNDGLIKRHYLFRAINRLILFRFLRLTATGIIRGPA